MTQLPAPPDGVRPGHLGVIVVGRVILGDIAATAVDLALRGMLRIESTDGGADGWSLTVPEPPGNGGDTLEYERVLLEWVARHPGGPAASLASLAADLPEGPAQVRDSVVRDAVRRGWLRRLHRHQRTRAGEELAGRLREFRRELRPARTGHPEILDGRLLPYALHFGMTSPDHPMARFAREWASSFAQRPDWRAPAQRRAGHDSDAGTPAAPSKRTLHEDIMSKDVAAMLWVTGW